MTRHVSCTQAYANNGWNKNFKLWANMTEKGPGFSPSGARLANVIWIHYLSKVWLTACRSVTSSSSQTL